MHQLELPNHYSFTSLNHYMDTQRVHTFSQSPRSITYSLEFKIISEINPTIIIIHIMIHYDLCEIVMPDTQLGLGHSVSDIHLLSFINYSMILSSYYDVLKRSFSHTDYDLGCTICLGRTILYSDITSQLCHALY